MKIIRVRPEEADALSKIAHAAKRHWGYPEPWMKAWRDVLTLRPEFLETNIAYAATENGRAVGFYVLTRESDGLHLDHLWILPSAMRRGLGRSLFNHAVEQARALEFRELMIEADPHAEGFYERMGATRSGTRVSTLTGERRELPLLLYRID